MMDVMLQYTSAEIIWEDGSQLGIIAYTDN